MKKSITVNIMLTVFLFANALYARELRGQEAQLKIQGAEKIIIGTRSEVPEFVQFRKEAQVPFTQWDAWAHQNFKLGAQYSFVLLNADKDALGMTHYRYRQTWNGLPLEATMIIVHVKNGMMVSVNGMAFNKVETSTSASMNESHALSRALNYMNAETYRWQVPMWESQLKMTSGNRNATWYPKGELMLAPAQGNFADASYRLAYRFDVYAETPLRREYVYVDAATGEIIYTQNRIHNSNTVATAVTVYSGNRQINTDSVNATSYRLRETVLGMGVETYNLQKGTTYTNTDFTDADNYWNNVNANLDQYAADAHWGAEMTYDFYWTKFGRNSIDNAGMKLFSYVHYSTNYTNAFWDGTEMTYGDGATPYTPLTSLDVTGHEISHGVTERTSGLIYSNESGAMNEAFSDCMGNSIRYYGKAPASIDWLIGDEIGGTPFRNMANPNQYQNPDTYGGLYWNNPNEVHNNSGVMNFWYYLLTEGGTGTNDLTNAYNVTGLGIDKASAICFRMNTVYLVPASTYADARVAAIQAATDLFGACSPEVNSTAAAWYAVGVGTGFDATVVSSFAASATSFCVVPATVNFTNTSANADAYMWYFGDGDSSSASSPSHDYLTPGTYTVTLNVSGGCGSDSHTTTNYIVVDPPTAPAASSLSICSGNSAVLNAAGSDSLFWYNASTGGSVLGSGTSYTTPVLSANTTYYVGSVISGPSQHAAAPDSTLGGGGYFANTNYHDLIFDVYQPLKLVSVKVYASGAGNRTITLIQNAVTLRSIVVNIPNGRSTVTLNWNIPAGTNYELGCGDGTFTVNLFRNNAGATYPITLNGMLSITGNNAGTAGYYYYFYDWIVQGAPCISARTPVTVTVNQPTGTPVFTGGVRVLCQDAPDETYTATATNSTSIAYSVAPSSAGTINSVTGVMNWDPSFTGIATITATATGPCGTTSADWLVTVNAIAAGYATATVGNNVDFTDNSTATGIIVSWHWDFGDGDTSNVQSPSHLFTDPNTYNVCLTVTDGNGCTNSTCQNVTVTDVGVQQLSSGTGISVFPNPVSDNLQIVFNSTAASTWILKLTNVVGQTVAERVLKEAQAGSRITWNLAPIAPGSYTLMLQNEKGERMMKRIIRQ